jgi:hypothetical protein
MDDLAQKAKEKVLQEIMDLMDSNMLGSLKSKDPKMMAISVEAKKPTEEEDPEQSLKDKLMGMSGDSDASDLEPKDEDDDLERLKELYDKLK